MAAKAGALNSTESGERLGLESLGFGRAIWLGRRARRERRARAAGAVGLVI